MTLTFAYIDGRFALHVADRRISIQNAKRGASQMRDDDAVKIVSPRASLLFSYTGAADLPHASAPLGDTALWLRDRFDTGGSDAQSGMSAVAAELTAVFKSERFEDRTLTGPAMLGATTRSLRGAIGSVPRLQIGCGQRAQCLLDGDIARQTERDPDLVLTSS